MINWTHNKKLCKAFLIGTALFSATNLASAGVVWAETPPPLIITNEPLPPDLQSKIYSTPTQVRTITPNQISGAAYFGESSQTNVGQKITNMREELFEVQRQVSTLAEDLAALEEKNQQMAAEYYASVATISTQLQSGTTPGNPRLVKKLGTARENLERLSGNIAMLNDLAQNISNTASMTSYLMESARAAYSLSGAIEEDHIRLAQIEDAVNNTMVVIDRLLNNVNDDISRTTAYIGSERNNLRTLSMAIRTGDLLGKSLSNRPFSNAAPANLQPASYPDSMTGTPAPDGFENDGLMDLQTPVAPPRPTGISEPRPLVKIRFDRADVAYEQPIYMAVNEALERYPNARFELIAVHPTQGNAAEVAIESTRARRNAERVLRSLTEMGLSVDQIDLSYMPSDEAGSNEVHLYIR